MLFPVVEKMAPLTECREIFRAVIGAVVVQMRHRQDDPEYSFVRLRLQSFGTVKYARPVTVSEYAVFDAALLAPVPGPFQNLRPDPRFPIRRIFRIINRHTHNSTFSSQFSQTLTAGFPENSQYRPSEYLTEPLQFSHFLTFLFLGSTRCQFAVGLNPAE